jgi:hypothetical protein
LIDWLIDNQWALVVPAVLYHARLMASLMEFEKRIDVQFNDHQLLKQVRLQFTH